MKKVQNIIPNLVLNNGVKMPCTGLGTFLSTDEKLMTKLLRASFGNFPFLF